MTSYKVYSLIFTLICSLILLVYYNGILSLKTALPWDPFNNTIQIESSTTALPRMKPFNNTIQTESSTTALARKHFIYLFQTESCLPANLVVPMRNASGSNNFDVIVASYKRPCEKKENYAPHISHLSALKSTWASGRNALLFAARNRTPGYVYYIFSDDDIEVKLNRYTPSEMKSSSRHPLRAFEDWLLDYEPAVGVLDYAGHYGAGWHFEKRRAVCGKIRSLTIPVVRYDAAFNAIHFKALPHLLPYRVEFDSTSWYHAPKGPQIAAEIKFRGQTMMFTGATIHNPKHRSYPKQSTFDDNYVWRKRINEALQLTPSEYRNDGIFKQIMLDPEKYFGTAKTLCMEVIKHKPIIPYAHFAESKVV